jgi:hypothetical protein
MKKVGGGSDGRMDCWMGGSPYILTMGDVNKPPLCKNFQTTLCPPTIHLVDDVLHTAWPC